MHPTRVVCEPLLRGLLEAKAVRKWKDDCSCLTKALGFNNCTLRVYSLRASETLVMGSGVALHSRGVRSSEHSGAS